MEMIESIQKILDEKAMSKEEKSLRIFVATLQWRREGDWPIDDMDDIGLPETDELFDLNPLRVIKDEGWIRTSEGDRWQGWHWTSKGEKVLEVFGLPLIDPEE